MPKGNFCVRFGCNINSLLFIYTCCGVELSQEVAELVSSTISELDVALLSVAVEEDGGGNTVVCNVSFVGLVIGNVMAVIVEIILGLISSKREGIDWESSFSVNSHNFGDNLNTSMLFITRIIFFNNSGRASLK